MTIYEYERSKRNKQIKKRVALVAAAVAIVAAVVCAYSQGVKAGRAAGVLAAFDDMTACVDNGGSGYYTTTTGVRCIYE